jgi:hypothetical protein
VFDPSADIYSIARVATYAVAIAGVLGAGYWTARRQKAASQTA